MPVGWRRAAKGTPDAAIAALERRLGRQLPREYRDFLLAHNGGEPDDNEFSIAGTDNASGVSEFLNLAAIEAELARPNHRLPPGLIPIAYAEGGNLVLLSADSGHVFFWDHELEHAQPLAPLAGDFRSFWEALQPFDASDVRLEPGQLKSAWIDPDLLH